MAKRPPVTSDMAWSVFDSSSTEIWTAACISVSGDEQLEHSSYANASNYLHSNILFVISISNIFQQNFRPSDGLYMIANVCDYYFENISLTNATPSFE